MRTQEFFIIHNNLCFKILYDRTLQIIDSLGNEFVNIKKKQFIY